jgi:hypothetical protein|tara:strand:- start:3704 stop:4171 length:468 start_codon:yes stop_codon:yes gene_type:complete
MGVISGYAPTMPLAYVEGEGFDMAPDIDTSIEEDLKCLLLSAGKIYDAGFGCGLNKYLFEQIDTLDLGEIEGVIHEQVDKYLRDYLRIVSVDFITIKDDPTLSPHVLVIQIRAQSKATGAAIPVSVSLDVGASAMTYATRGTTFTGQQHNWLLTE